MWLQVQKMKRKCPPVLPEVTPNALEYFVWTMTRSGGMGRQLVKDWYKEKLRNLYGAALTYEEYLEGIKQDGPQRNQVPIRCLGTPFFKTANGYVSYRFRRVSAQYVCLVASYLGCSLYFFRFPISSCPIFYNSCDMESELVVGSWHFRDGMSKLLVNKI